MITKLVQEMLVETLVQLNRRGLVFATTKISKV